MTIYITFKAYAKQYNREVLKQAIISYEKDWGNGLRVYDDKTNDYGIAETTWDDVWIGKTIYVYCNGKFVTSKTIVSNDVVPFNIDYPDRDPR